MVGRARELERLRAAMAQAVTDGSCQLFTVLGAAGVGKSRLSHEFLDGLDGATVVRGTCLSYGEGITYWPVVEILKQLLRAEPEARLSELGLDRGAAHAILAVLGEGDLQTSGEEIAWAVRRLLEAEAAASAARRRARRHPLGRGRVPRPGRPRRRSEPRRADPAALHGAARAARRVGRTGAAAS